MTTGEKRRRTAKARRKARIRAQVKAVRARLIGGGSFITTHVEVGGGFFVPRTMSSVE